MGTSDDRAELVDSDTSDYGATAEQGDDQNWELNKAYDLIGLGPAQYLYWLVSFLVAYSDYAELTLIAIIIPSLRCEWELTEMFEATITISIFAIYAISAICCGKLSDIYGRKTIMSYTLVILMLSAVGAALSINKYMFLFFRSITGACIGANFATVIVYSTEFCQNKHRAIGPLIGIQGSYTSMFAVNFLGWLFLNSDSVGWRWLIIIITLPAIPAYILLMILPESPRYLCASGQADKATHAVRFMAKLNKQKIPDDVTIFCYQDQALGTFKEVFSPKYRRCSIALGAMYFMNIFIETAILVFLPLAFMSDFCGGGGEAPERTCDSLSQSDLLKLSLSAFGSIVGCFVAFFVAIKIGRLTPLRLSCGLQILVLAVMYVCVNDTFTLGVVTAIKIVNAFICMMLWIIIPESFPTIIRNTATGFINSCGKSGAVAGTAMVYLLFYVSPMLVISAFVVAGIASAIGSGVLNHETRDVVLTET